MGGPESPYHPARILAPCNRRQDIELGQPGWRLAEPTLFTGGVHPRADGLERDRLC